MSEIMETFKKCLQSDFSCDEVNEEMVKVSKIKVNKNINEENINKIFFQFCSHNFKDEFISFLKNEKEFSICKKYV